MVQWLRSLKTSTLLKYIEISDFSPFAQFCTSCGLGKIFFILILIFFKGFAYNKKAKFQKVVLLSLPRKEAVIMFDSESASGKIKPISELHGLLMSVKEVVVLDIETTGFSPEKHAEIIEIGALRLDVWSGAKRMLPQNPSTLCPNRSTHKACQGSSHKRGALPPSCGVRRAAVAALAALRACARKPRAGAFWSGTQNAAHL